MPVTQRFAKTAAPIVQEGVAALLNTGNVTRGPAFGMTRLSELSRSDMSMIQMPTPPSISSSSPVANIMSGVMGTLGMAGVGAAVGGAGAMMSGGNITPGTVYGGILGGAMGALSARGGMSSMLQLGRAHALVRDMPQVAERLGQASMMSSKTFGRIGAGVGGMIGGIGFSGNRGQNKSRGLNSARGNRISSGRY